VTTCTACTSPQVTTLSGQSSCRFCGLGQYAMTGLSACGNCPLGTYWDSATSGATVCKTCDAGKVAISTGLSSCSVCALGHYALSTSQCSQCPIGKFWNSSTQGTTACLTCAAGSVSGLGASTCSLCGPGRYADQSKSVCQNCVAGTYSALTANSACTKCAAGTYSSTVGAQSASACKGCLGGNYSTQDGSTACLFCGNDTPGSRPANFSQTGEDPKLEYLHMHVYIRMYPHDMTNDTTHVCFWRSVRDSVRTWAGANLEEHASVQARALLHVHAVHQNVRQQPKCIRIRVISRYMHALPGLRRRFLPVCSLHADQQHQLRELPRVRWRSQLHHHKLHGQHAFHVHTMPPALRRIRVRIFAVHEVPGQAVRCMQRGMQRRSLQDSQLQCQGRHAVRSLLDVQGWLLREQELLVKFQPQLFCVPAWILFRHGQ
jgi:hypothetical protein